MHDKPVFEVEAETWRLKVETWMLIVEGWRAMWFAVQAANEGCGLEWVSSWMDDIALRLAAQEKDVQFAAGEIVDPRFWSVERSEMETGAL